MHIRHVWKDKIVFHFVKGVQWNAEKQTNFVSFSVELYYNFIIRFFYSQLHEDYVYGSIGPLIERI